MPSAEPHGCCAEPFGFCTNGSAVENGGQHADVIAARDVPSVAPKPRELMAGDGISSPILLGLGVAVSKFAIRYTCV